MPTLTFVRYRLRSFHEFARGRRARRDLLKKRKRLEGALKEHERLARENPESKRERNIVQKLRRKLNETTPQLAIPGAAGDVTVDVSKEAMRHFMQKHKEGTLPAIFRAEGIEIAHFHEIVPGEECEVWGRAHCDSDEEISRTLKDVACRIVLPYTEK